MAKGVRTSVFKRNVSWQLVGTASQMVLSVLVLLLLGRELDASGFGEYSIIMGFVTVANLLMEPRMQDVAARQFWNLDGDETGLGDHRNFFVDLFAFEALCKLLPCAALILLSGWLANVAHLPPEGAMLITVGAVGTYFAKLGFGLSTGVHRVLGRSDQLAYCATGELLLRLALLIAFAKLSQLTVVTAIAAQCVAGSVSNASQLRLAVRHLRGFGGALRSWRPRASLLRLRRHRGTLLWNIGFSGSDLMNKDLDVALLAPMMPATEIGIYKMAKNIALLAWRAVDPFYIALMPELNRLVALRDYARTSRLLIQSALGLAALAASMSLCAFAAVHYLGERLLGPAFVEVPSIMMWMIVGIVASAPLVWAHPFAVALNRADVAFLGTLFGSLLGLAALLVLAPVFGAAGASAAWSLTLISGFVFTSVATLRALKRHKAIEDSRHLARDPNHVSAERSNP